MKKIFSILIMIIMAMVPFAFAQVEATKTGALPTDGFNYWVKRAYENVDLALTFDKSKWLEKKQFYMSVRVKEIEDLHDKNVTEDVVNKVSDEANKDAQDLNDESDKQTNITREYIRQHVLEMQQKHLIVLNNIKAKLAERNISSPGIDVAIAKAMVRLDYVSAGGDTEVRHDVKDMIDNMMNDLGENHNITKYNLSELDKLKIEGFREHMRVRLENVSDHIETE